MREFSCSFYSSTSHKHSGLPHTKKSVRCCFLNSSSSSYVPSFLIKVGDYFPKRFPEASPLFVPQPKFFFLPMPFFPPPCRITYKREYFCHCKVCAPICCFSAVSNSDSFIYDSINSVQGILSICL